MAGKPPFREGKQSACPTLSDFAPAKAAEMRAEARTHFPERRCNTKTNKNIRITLRLTPEQYDSIAARAETAQMPVGAYVRAAAMRHKVVVIDGLKEITHELKGVGRNLNRLVILANQGHIKEVRLADTFEAMAKIYLQLRDLTEQERT